MSLIGYWIIILNVPCWENHSLIPPGQSALPAGLTVLTYGVNDTAAQAQNTGAVLDCSCFRTSKIICKEPDSPFTLGFAGHNLSVTSIQLCYCRRKAAIDNSKAVGMTVFHKNYIQKQMEGWIWPEGGSLPTLVYFAHTLASNALQTLLALPSKYPLNMSTSHHFCHLLPEPLNIFQTSTLASSSQFSIEQSEYSF